MRVVVTGATGNVGTALLRRLADEPEVSEVVGVARRRPDWQPAKVEWVRADVAEDDLTESFRGADAVVHLAWLLQPSHRPLTTWHANVHGTERVLEAVRAAGVAALVYASSVGAYSPGPKDRAVAEDWPTYGWPTAAYCREKACVESLLDVFEPGTPSCRVVRMRPGFIFQRESAAQQRRLFIGPGLPSPLVRKAAVPVVPDIAGMRLQALHAADAADAYARAVLREVSGAFNLAADPVLDAQRFAELMQARTVRMPRGVVRGALAAAWHLRVTPSSPHLFDAAMRLPLMDTERARRELEWSPRYSAVDAVDEFLSGLRSDAGFGTPPLSPATSGRLRSHEIATGVGGRP